MNLASSSTTSMRSTLYFVNERIGVTSLYEGRDFLYKLVKIYADQP